MKDVLVVCQNKLQLESRTVDYFKSISNDPDDDGDNLLYSVCPTKSLLAGH